MTGPAAALLLAGLGLGLVPTLAPLAGAAAVRFQDFGLYAGVVLGGQLPLPLGPSPADAHPSLTGLALSLVSGTAALALALAALLGPRLGWVPDRQVRRLLVRGMAPLRSLQSGRVGDYVAWIVAGTAVYGVVLAAAIR